MRTIHPPNEAEPALDQFAAELGETRTFDPRYNIAPTQDVLAIRHPRQLVALRWGLIPSWAKDAKIPMLGSDGQFWAFCSEVCQVQFPPEQFSIG